MANGVTPAALEAALDAAPDARAAWIVSPTYYGMAADVAGCAEVAHAAGVPLVVDQSWGPHLGFHRDLPPSALTQTIQVANPGLATYVVTGLNSGSWYFAVRAYNGSGAESANSNTVSKAIP